MDSIDKNLTGEELIASVKEVKITIRDHRADDDFEKMFAELNAKREQKLAQSATAEKTVERPSEGSAEKNFETPKPETPKPTEKPSDKPAEKPSEAPKPEVQAGPKAVPAMTMAVMPAAMPSAPTKKKRRKPKPRLAEAETKQTAVEAAVETAVEAAQQAPAEAAPEPKPEPIPEPIPEPPAEPTAELTELFGENSAIWNNPDLSAGGRVSMNIKTGLRKEIKITVEPEVIERKRIEALEEQAKLDAARRENERLALEQEQTAELKAVELKRERARAKREARERARAQQVSNGFKAANGVICFCLFVGIGFYLIICSRQSGFIESENRNLAEKPTLSVKTLTDGSYFEDITKWYTDTLPFREKLKPFSSGFSKLFGIKLNDVKITGDIAPVQKEVFEGDDTSNEVEINTDFSSKPVNESRAESTSSVTESLADVPEELDDGEWLGNVVVSGRGENVRAMSAFYGTFDLGAKYAETINRYKDDLGYSVNVYTMNMPLSSAYYMPENLADDFTSQHDCIKNIGSCLRGIVNVDVYDALDEHKDEYIYSRTDHHWQPLGAYYAAQVFAETAKVDFADISTYQTCRIEDFVGTMYAYSDYDEELNNNPDTFIYHKPDNNYTVTYYDSKFKNGSPGTLFYDYAEGINCYSAILGTDDTIAEIETDCTNGRVLVIMKDSFGNALVPYLTHSFSKIYVCDFRYFEINAIDFCEKVGCTDFLFAVSLSAAHTESHINAIGNDRIQITETDLENWDLPDTVLPEDSAADNSSDEEIPAEEPAEEENSGE